MTKDADTTLPPPCGGLPRCRITPGLRRREAMQRFGQRLTRRLQRVKSRVATVPPRGERVGRALISYWIEPFLSQPGGDVPLGHTHYWESRQVATLYADLGYEVDVIHWTNRSFLPKKAYDLFIDVRLNLERIAPQLPSHCLKIQHIETGSYRFHNPAQLRRLEYLKERRGITLRPYKMVEPNRAIEVADYGITTGNAFTVGTYAFAGKRIFAVPISAPHQYPAPVGKDFDAARRRFLWFGGDGFVHKGLDLVLDAFAAMPEYELVVCGPLAAEPAFCAAYDQELFHTPNIHPVGWVENGSELFRRVMATCGALVYPSCSEGGGASCLPCLHAGLVPIVTYETSINVDPSFGTLLPDDRVATIQAAVRRIAEAPAADLRDRAMAARAFARAHHTREIYVERYLDALAELADDWRSRGHDLPGIPSRAEGKS